MAKDPLFSHGIRQSKLEGQEQNGTWKDYVLSILQNDIAANVHSDRTNEAENAFGLKPSFYLFMMTATPPYNGIIFLCSIKGSPTDLGMTVTPFDSGGLWHDYHVAGLSPNQKKKLFQKYTYCHDYTVEFANHLDENYQGLNNVDSCNAYIDGIAPSCGWWKTENLELKSEQERKICPPCAWSWEVRIPRKKVNASIKIERIILQQRYLDQLQGMIGDPDADNKWCDENLMYNLNQLAHSPRGHSVLEEAIRLLKGSRYLS